ncbi:MAG: PDZ domain-containing protein [Streptosporangiaceae bacterium]
MGVAIAPRSAVAPGNVGVLVTGVVPGGPAGRAGIRPGDVVLAVNGTSVDDAAALIRAVAVLPPGARARVAIDRNGERIGFRVRIGERPASTEG